MQSNKFCNILIDDFENISTEISDEFNGKTFLVTGATGLVGSLIIKSILFCNKKKDFNIKVIAVVRNLDKAKKIFGNNFNKIEYIVSDIIDFTECDFHVDYIIHCACNTTSKYLVTKPVEAIRTALRGTENVFEIAKNKKVQSCIYVSSMEMYGTMDGKNYYASEKNIGYIDIMNERSCYPESKRMCENMAYCYFKEYNVPVKIVRLAQTFGAGVQLEDTRIFSYLAKCIINDEDIVLNSDGSSFGNYCYTSDTLRAIFLLLKNGENGEAYNISNEENNVTIRQMAETVCNTFSNKSKVIFNIPNTNIYGYAAPVKLKLNTDKIKKLGWEPQYNLTEMYERLIKYYRYITNGFM